MTKQSNTHLSHLYIFLLFFCYAIFFGWKYLFPHFSIDSFGTNIDMFGAAKQTMSLGRFLTGTVFILLSKLGISIIENQIWFTVFSLVVLAFASTKLFELIKASTGGDSPLFQIILFGSICLISFNLFTTELFAFPELTPFSSLAWFFLVSAIETSVAGNSIQKYVKACIFLLLSLFLYQTWVSLYLPLVLIYLMAAREFDIASLIRKIYPYVTSYFVANLTQFLLIRLLIVVKVFPAGRFGSVNLISNLLEISGQFKNIFFDGLRVFPKGFFISGVIVSFVLSIIALSLMNKFHKKTAVILTSLSIILLLAFSLLPILVTQPIWIVPRTVCGIGSLLGVFGIINLLISRQIGKPSVQISYSISLLIILILFCFVSISRANLLASQQLEVNKMDQQKVAAYQTVIEQYEIENKISIKELRFLNDATVSDCYERTICFSGTIINMLAVDYIRVQIMNYYSGRTFTMSDKQPPENFLLKTKNDYNALDEGMVVFSGNTAFILIY